MNRVSRRSLARFAVDELLSGQPASQVARRIVATLAADGKLAEAEYLTGDIAWELERRGELTVGKVTSATPLNRQLVEALEAQIKKAIGSKQVLLEAEVDKSVLGGLRVETSGRVWDATVSQKLSRIREAF